jgi:hypothetical protein
VTGGRYGVAHYLIFAPNSNKCFLLLIIFLVIQNTDAKDRIFMHGNWNLDSFEPPFGGGSALTTYNGAPRITANAPL